jgi:hypothetical protein
MNPDEVAGGSGPWVCVVFGLVALITIAVLVLLGLA